jgi:cysteine desulfurase
VLHGGGQERDVRSGTSTPPRSGRLRWRSSTLARRRDEHAARLGRLRDDRIGQVRAAVPDAILAARRPESRPPGNAHFSFPGCEGDALLMLLDARGVACSTGSACTAGVAQPSHVLLAMGADHARARGSLRFSLGRTSTQADVTALGAVIGEVVERARRAGRQTAGATRAGGSAAAQVAGQAAAS